MATTVLDQHAVGQLLDDLIDAYNRHDVDGVLSCCTDDVDWQDPIAGTMRGKDTIRGALRSVFAAFPDLHFPKDELIRYLSFDGSRGASSWHLMGTMTGHLDPPGYAPTKGPVSFSGTCLYEFRDGLISRHTIVFDMVDLGRQIGALPASGGVLDKMAVFLQRLTASRARR